MFLLIWIGFFLTSESGQDWIDLFYFHFWVMASPHRNIFMWQATHLSCRKAAIRQTTRKMAATRPMLIFCFCKEPRECKLFEISRKNVIIQGKEGTSASLKTPIDSLRQDGASLSGNFSMPIIK